MKQAAKMMLDEAMMRAAATGRVVWYCPYTRRFALGLATRYPVGLDVPTGAKAKR